MFADALQKLIDLSRLAAKPELVETDSRRKIVAVDGKLLTVDLPPPPRDHDVKSLEDLVALANRFADAGSKPVVWFDEDSVELVIDDEGHRTERVTLQLEESDVFARVVELGGQRPSFNQKQFIRLLRIELAGTLEPRELLERVRRVQFENGSLTTGKVERGQESLGRSITNKVQSEMGEIPEEVTLTLPVYKTKGEKELYGLRCSVEVDPAMGTFQLLPLPDQIERVQQNAVESIGERLGAGLSEGIPAYYGSA